MEPVDGASNFGANLQKPVMTGDVGEFVGEHHAAAAFGPLRGARGKNDDGTKDSPSERHRGRAVAFQKTDRSTDFVDVRKLQDGANPILVEEGLCTCGDPPEASKTYYKP